MFEADFFIDGFVIFGIGLWPLLVVVAATAVRWFNARRTAAAAAVSSVSLPHVAPARPRALAYAGQ
ncbi:hypothetical protein BOO86_27400 [Mycobacterium sp. CBMA 234]|uniref:hypothetical protein n=1 Tax=Mycolicibacterium sp. CBMA 234 TaxID=1918495 RepID=UPI0012DC56EC|nr:hypothetical protein [Mycolicibacterium sp. CBMA 234]MUL68226.1 hypothetical protein [Mycolicibacterium sp. CBMA 234]